MTSNTRHKLQTVLAAAFYLKQHPTYGKVWRRIWQEGRVVTRWLELSDGNLTLKYMSGQSLPYCTELNDLVAHDWVGSEEDLVR